MRRRPSYLFGLSWFLNWGVPYGFPRFGGSSLNLAYMHSAYSFRTSLIDLGDFGATLPPRIYEVSRNFDCGWYGIQGLEFSIKRLGSRTLRSIRFRFRAQG